MHAEEALVRSDSWSDAVAAARANVASGGAARITLLINRTPCVSCVNWLKDAIGDAKRLLGTNASAVTFLIATTGTYRRRAKLSDADIAMLTAGAQRVAEKTGRDFDQVFEEERRFWIEDIESSSTEWQDSDGEEYSGLSELASAGWQLAGIDTGKPPTPRQLKFAQITGRLAQQFGWSS